MLVLKSLLHALFFHLNKHLAFLSFLMVGVGVRFWNLPERLYFISDQGRDMLKIKNILLGDLTLLGPTSGLPGFFLGPLWYYLGLPGYWLGQGSPFWLSAWYVSLACLALPFYWFLSKQLFTQTSWQRFAALSLSLMPFSQKASIFIWNPLLSLPLMAASLYCLIKSKEQNLYVIPGMMLLALVLQSEFAYGIFLVGPVWLLTQWITQKRDFKLYGWGALAIIATLLPQLLFELKNNWLLSKNVLSAITSGDNTLSWSTLLAHRPTQLFHIFEKLLFGNVPNAYYVAIITFIAITIYSVILLWQKTTPRAWKITALIYLLPVIGFSLWRGNYGVIFEYYLHPHTIVTTLIMLKLIHSLYSMKKWWATLPAFILVGLMSFAMYRYIRYDIISLPNDAGLLKMQSSVQTIIDWIKDDSPEKYSWMVYTPNFVTDNYDMIIQSLSAKNSSPVPITVPQANDTFRYLLMEPENDLVEVRFNPWYRTATTGGELVRRERRGVLTLETWKFAR